MRCIDPKMSLPPPYIIGEIPEMTFLRKFLSSENGDSIVISREKEEIAISPDNFSINCVLNFLAASRRDKIVEESRCEIS